MSGTFNLDFWHAVPAVESWRTLLHGLRTVRRLPEDELAEADKVFQDSEMKIRYNVTIRWHESHYNGCPYLCGLAAQIHVPQGPGRTIQVDGNDPEGPSLSKLRAVEKAIAKAAVRDIVRPVVRPRPPPEKPQSDQPSSTSSACAARNEKAVETQWVDTEQVTVTKANLFRLFADVTSGAPDWTNLLAHLPLLPNRASESHDYKMLKLLRDTQARYVHQLSNIKERYFDGATESNLKAAKQMLRAESQKLSLLETRVVIYNTIMEQIKQVGFNEIRLATNHSSNNNTKVRRVIVTFKQASMLVDAISVPDIAKKNMLIVDISKLSSWDWDKGCYLRLDVFKSGSMEVETKNFLEKYVQIKYFEASWPGAPVAHRIEPLHGTMHAQTKRRFPSNVEVQQQVVATGLKFA